MKIKQINFGFLGVADNINMIVLPFSTTDEQTTIKYTLYSDKNTLISEGEYLLSKEEFSNWAENNNYIEDCVLSHLGLERL